MNLNPASIEIIDQVSSGDLPCLYSEKMVLKLLQQQVTLMEHGEQFTGRPQTQVYYNKAHVLKTHTALNFSAIISKRWVQQQLEKEREMQVYHPQKTWLLLHFADKVVIGNIMPRLQALHECMEKPEPEVDTNKALQVFSQLFNMYFELSKRTGRRLDEGLSNFALDNKHQLYYIDDDIYERDNWIALSHIIGVYLRKLPWLKADIAYQFGRICQQAMLTHLQDKHFLTVLAELLNDIFMPTSRETDLREFKRGLQSLEPIKTTVSSITTANISPAPAAVVSKIKPLKTTDRYWVLLADIHANLPALEAVLNFIEQQAWQTILILGDIVGYGPHPQACIQRLQTLGCTVIKGNHDHALGGADYSRGYSRTARWVLDWSQDKVSNADKQWLQDLPPVLHNKHYLAVHGAPIDPNFFQGYVYAMTYEDNLDVLEKKQKPLCFHGHTHIPGVYARYQGKVDKHHSSPGQTVKFDLSSAQHSLICPGSVGQPRNRQSGAEFAVYDWETQQIQYYCLEYDQSTLVNDMLQQQFPESLVQVFR